MARNHILNTLFCCCLACLAPVMMQASEHHGVVKFAGLPVPGATVTATMGDKKMVAVTGPQGVYSFRRPGGRRVEPAGGDALLQPP